MHLKQNRKFVSLWNCKYFNWLIKKIFFLNFRITGGELFERVIDDDFILTERLCELYMMQICEGVNFIHSCNIIHLDMKVREFYFNFKNNLSILFFFIAGEYFMFKSSWSSNKNN